MSRNRPIGFYWDGECMTPHSPTLADKQFVVGETYVLAAHEERSPESHSHEFAWLKQAWSNLPEQYADLYATPEHLRKRALIEAGYYDEMIVDAGSKGAAIRVAAAFRQIDDFAWVIVRGVHVIRRTAKSQSRRSMNKEEFQASKTAILEIVSGMIGVTPEVLANEGQAA